MITLNLVPKSGDPQRDRLAADPLQEKKRLDDEWKRRGEKVLPGTQGWLPESDWSKLKRKVYRIEAALLSQEDPSAPASGRIYLDQYIVQFTRNETMMMTAMTTRDPHVAFRDKAESLIKKLRASVPPKARSRLPPPPLPAHLPSAKVNIDCLAAIAYPDHLTTRSRKTPSGRSARIGPAWKPAS